MATLVTQLVHNVEVRKAGEGIPTPTLTLVVAVGGEEARQNHNDVRDYEHEDAGTIESGEDREVEEQ